MKVVRNRIVVTLLLHRCQHGITVFASRLRMLLRVAQWLEHLREFAIDRALQPEHCGLKRCRRIAAPAFVVCTYCPGSL